MKKFKSILMLCMLLFTISACNEDILGPIPNDGSVPGPVSNVTVQNFPGGALISYSLPDNASLLYVRAEYQFQGAKVNTISSYYKNSIVLEGFADTTAKTVKLYAVSRGEKSSTPVSVEIKPEQAPIVDVLKSLQVSESFGGFLVNFNNPRNLITNLPNNVVIGVLRLDTLTNEWKQIDAYYTSMEIAKFSTRGLDSTVQQFGFYARDKWENKTDTIKMTLKPVYEVQLDGTTFVDMRKTAIVPQMRPLPASGKPMVCMVDYSSSYPFKNLFDGKPSTMFHTKEKYELPVWLPIDLGKKTLLSRFKIWQRQDSKNTYVFNHGNPHEWEIWGTNTPNDPTSWVLLTHEISVKPSNLPLGTNSNDDIDAARNGVEYMMPEGIPAVRYIGWKNIDSWASIEGSTGFFHLGELAFWGQIVQ